MVVQEDLLWCNSDNEIVFWIDCSINDLYLWVSIDTPWKMFLKMTDCSVLSFCSKI